MNTSWLKPPLAKNQCSPENAVASASDFTNLLTRASFPPIVMAAARILAPSTPTAFLVGGVVRDAILGRETWDVDIAISASSIETGEELARLMGGRLIVLDEKRGYARVVIAGEEKASVDLTPLKNGILPDLGRRDFTVDAMAIPLSDVWSESGRVELIDPYGGLKDLRDGAIRAISSDVFASDPGRLMRAPRLAIQLGFHIAGETCEMIKHNAHLLDAVSSERVRDELFQILAEPGATDSLRLLDDLGLLRRVFPELSEARGVAQPKEHYWDVFNHCLETPGQVERVLGVGAETEGFVGAGVPRFDSWEAYFAQKVSDGPTRLTLLKLAALLHDVAKPRTKTIEEDGRMRFFGHDKQGGDMASHMLERLRLSSRGVDIVRCMIENHLRPTQMSQNVELPTAKAVYRFYRDLGDAAIDTLYLNMADYLAARGAYLDEDEWGAHCELIGHILREGLAPRSSPVAPGLLNGKDIMKKFSLEPGPEIGVLLKLVGEAQASGEIATRGGAVELVRVKLEAGGGIA